MSFPSAVNVIKNIKIKVQFFFLSKKPCTFSDLDQTLIIILGIPQLHLTPILFKKGY